MSTPPPPPPPPVPLRFVRLVLLCLPRFVRLRVAGAPPLLRLTLRATPARRPMRAAKTAETLSLARSLQPRSPLYCLARISCSRLRASPNLDSRSSSQGLALAPNQSTSAMITAPPPFSALGRGCGLVALAASCNLTGSWSGLQRRAATCELTHLLAARLRKPIDVASR